MKLTPLNNTIKYKLTQNATEQSAIIDAGTYTQNNYETLFTNMTTKLNQSLTSSILNNGNVGQQWLVSLDDGRASIQQRLSKRLNYTDWTGTIVKNVTKTGTNSGATLKGAADVGS